MDAEVIVAIVAAVIALGAAFVAFRQAREARKAREAAERQAAAAEAEVAEAREANRLAQQQLDELREERQKRSRAEQRDAVLTVLRTGEEWARRADVVLGAMSVTSPVTVVDSEFSRVYGVATDQSRAALVRCQYLVADMDMMPIIDSLVVKRAELWQMVQELFTAARSQSGGVGQQVRDRAFQIPAGTELLLGELHDLAVARLGVSASSGSTRTDPPLTSTAGEQTT